MIRFIAAIDSKRGIADDKGIPWDLPTDKAYYRAKIRGQDYLIGYATYVHHTKPLPDTPTFVASEETGDLRPGFKKVTDARAFLTSRSEDVWVGGGAGLFESVFDLADELYLTRIDADFNCTKFFPEFESDFELVNSTEPQTENNTTFRFQIWKHK